MCRNFCEEEVTCFNNIMDYQKERWIYRGQREAKWPLRTTLERACRDFYDDLTTAERLEKHLMREFRRRYHHYSIHIPRGENSIEWLSLMQHYGAPTRLLDWTYSIHVALYFAIEKQSDPTNKKTTPDTKGEHNDNDKFGDHAVWAMDMDWCEEAAASIVKEKREKWQHLRKAITEKNERTFSKTFLVETPHLPLVYPINPFRLSERLVLQKGVFIITGDVSKPFEENLRSLQGCDDGSKLIKLRIPDRLRKDFLKKLSQMNITRANLFPGLDGYAESLAVFPPPPSSYYDELNAKDEGLDQCPGKPVD